MEYLEPEEYRFKLEENLGNIKNPEQEVSLFFKILVQTYKLYQITNVKEYLDVFDEFIEKRERISKINLKIEGKNCIPYKQINDILKESKISPIKSLLEIFLEPRKNN